MQSNTIGSAIADVEEIESNVDAIRRKLDSEQLAPSDHQYVARCFDLLEMELRALRKYLAGISRT